MLFNNGWSFHKGPLGAHLEKEALKPVEIPHDWLVYNANDLYEDSQGWYYKTFDRPAGEKVFIQFDGVYMDCTIYINSLKAFEWKYGYSAFEVDATPHLKDGQNEILVQVVHQAPNSRWYSGAGIYRNIHIETKAACHIAHNGVYITPVLQADGSWLVEADTQVACDKAYTLEHRIVGEESLHIQSPRLWSLEEPNLYTLETRLMVEGTCTDTALNTFGLRSLRFDANEGLFLNGNHIKLFGTCEHHDLGALGAAFNKTAMRRKLTLLKKMGVNALRTSHNMPAKEVMNLCDEMGLLVVSEGFDMWERAKTPYDYARFFKKWMPSDVQSWIQRDRNHPCLMMWSIGNEIYDTHADQRGQEVTVLLSQEVRSHDPKSHAIITIGSNYMPWENANKCADLVEAAGYNYAERLYEDHHKKYPQRIIYGSETASTVQSRGIYHFPLMQSLLADDDEQCSSLGNSTTSWGAKNTEYNIEMDLNAKFSLGQFIWTGFDYIGEPTPYHTKNSYFGQLDTAGFPKDSFYIYQSYWTDYKKNPMVHITPYWDFSVGQPIDVRVFSNAPRVELFFNGMPVKPGTLPYEKGVLKAIAYDENGSIIATDTQASFGNAASLKLNADKQTLYADGSDLIFVEISALDENHLPVQNASNRVHVQVTGAGRLIGLDNGDSTDYDQYKGTSRRLFSGKLLAIIAARHTPGDIQVAVFSPGLPEAAMLLKAVSAPIPQGSSDTLLENTPSPENAELPIRKIELISPHGFEMTKECPSLTVTAKILPENASYQDLTWRLTNQAGIDTNLAKLVFNGNTAVIQALGDGEVWLRAMTHNGKDGYSIISQQRFRIAGVGAAALNPYGFISGGLYNASNLPMTNGNERGVATLRDGVSHVGFKNVDFGSFGSDTITLPVFAMDQEPFEMEIWEGMPEDKGSEKVATVIYDLGSVWNTYKEITYTLPRRFKGLTTLCFKVNRKIHIKGFSFASQKAIAKLNALDCDKIYGDTFAKTTTAVEGIGNNVSLVFDDMAFNGGSYTLAILGRTPLDKNTLQVEFNHGGNITRELIEFTYAANYETQTFPLTIEKGSCTVTFIFLPGCQFDFKSFQFRKESK